MTQEELRQQLQFTRDNLVRIRGELAYNECREQELLAQVKQKTERCQVCLGTGTTKERDHASGYTVDTECRNCKGTGVWHEPV